MELRNLVAMLAVSIAASVICGIVAFAVPISVTSQGEPAGPSPYRAEIDELYAKTSKGLPPDAKEWALLEDLRIKNNEWFEAGNGAIVETLTPIQVLERRSRALAPVFSLIWAIALLVYARGSFKPLAPILLSVPIIMALGHLISLVALVWIFVGIMGAHVYLWTRDKASAAD